MTLLSGYILELSLNVSIPPLVRGIEKVSQHWATKDNGRTASFFQPSWALMRKSVAQNLDAFTRMHCSCSRTCAN